MSELVNESYEEFNCEECNGWIESQTLEEHVVSRQHQDSVRALGDETPLDVVRRLQSKSERACKTEVLQERNQNVRINDKELVNESYDEFHCEECNGWIEDQTLEEHVISRQHQDSVRALDDETPLDVVRRLQCKSERACKTEVLQERDQNVCTKDKESAKSFVIEISSDEEANETSSDENDCYDNSENEVLINHLEPSHDEAMIRNRGTVAFCVVCDVSFKGSPKNRKEHLRSVSHRTKKLWVQGDPDLYALGLSFDNFGLT